MIAKILFFLFLLPSVALSFCFEDAARMYGLNVNLLKSIARVESNFDARAMNINRNGSYDIGVMQINSRWISRLGLDGNELTNNACYNVMTGAKILRACIDKHGYTWEAVGCYNAVSTPHRVRYAWKIYDSLKRESYRSVSTVHSRKHSTLSFSAIDITEMERP